MGAIDEILPRVMIESLQVYLVMSGILLQVAIINWWMIFPMMIMGFCFYQVQQFYISAARGVKRLEGTSEYLIFIEILPTYPCHKSVARDLFL